jgi:DNA polymerase III delta subunit
MSDPVAPTCGVVVVVGDDEALVGAARRRVVEDHLGGLDPTLAVTTLEWGPGVIGAAVLDCQTPPFLVDRRVVVVDAIGRLEAAETDALSKLAGEAPPWSTLVLVFPGSAAKERRWAASTPGVELVDAARPRGGRSVASWVHEQLREAGLRPSASAVEALVAQVGEDMGRVPGLAAMLRSTLGEGAKVQPEDVVAYAGAAGGVPPWELTNAILSGSVEATLVTLHRMLDGSGRAPLAVLATLSRPVLDALAIDGEERAVPGSPAERSAHSLLEGLGRQGVQEAIELLDQADDDLKGGSALPAEVVLEVLVARLAAAVRRNRRSLGPGRGRARRS